MNASTSIHYPGHLDAAAAAVATAATAWRNPVLVFRTADLQQVGAHDATVPVVVPDGCIAVSPPTRYIDADDLGDLCAHRVRKALLRAGHSTGSLREIQVVDAVTAITALVGAAMRRTEPVEFMALRFADLREIDLSDARMTDPRAVGGVLWIPTSGLPASWPEAKDAARARIEAALHGCPTDLRGVPAPPQQQLAA